MIRLFRTVMAILIFVCLLPLISSAGADFVAHLYGCTLDLASVKPCMAGGTDIGEALLTFGMMGYFLFATMPILVGLIAFWIIVELVRWVGARSRSAA